MSAPGRGVLYITYDGLLEPLGQSQILAYQEYLVHDRAVHILSFEKRQDWRKVSQRQALEDRICQAGMHWHPRIYHKNPSALATWYDITLGTLCALWLVLRHRLAIVHARSYVPSVMALVVKKITRVKFIFDMRGFWADERVDGGLWPPGGRLYRVAKWFERRFLLNADHVVSLTRAARDEMLSFEYLNGRRLPVTVIPTCVDLQRFMPGSLPRGDDFVLGYVGSAGTWYFFDEVIRAFKFLLSLRPTANLLIINRGEQEYIRERLQEFDVPGARYQIKSVGHAEMPAQMSRMHAGIFFIKPLYSKLASAPTRLGEFLGCGVPCLSNAGVGDMTDILTRDKIGLVLDGFESDDLNRGITGLLALAEDPGVAMRCRESARRHFSLESGVAAYSAIYRSLEYR